MALLVVVVLVMFVSLAAYRYSFEMENEYRLTRLQEEQVQARLSAQSGIEFAASLLEQPYQIRQSMLTQAQDASELFRREVERSNSLESAMRTDREESRWRFAILSGSELASTPGAEGGLQGAIGGTEATQWKWGLESESAKLHIPTLLRWNQMQPGLARRVLLTLPEADEETVDGWLASMGVRTATTAAQDALQVAMGGGMQSNLQRQQRTRSLERFQLRWHGGDLDQNYRLDPWEETLLERLLIDPGVGAPSMTPMARELSKVNATAMGQGVGVNLEGQSTGAWNRYLTWLQGERNERPSGKRRIWLNQPDMRQLHKELSEVMSASEANFVVAMRQFGPGTSNIPSTSNSASSGGVAASTAQRGVAGGVAGAASSVSSGTGSAGTQRASVQRGVSGMGGSASTWVPNLQMPARYAFKSPLEVVERTVTVETGVSGTSSGSPAAGAAVKKPSGQSVTSPFSGGSPDMKARLAKLLAETTTVEQPVIEGRVDIVTAPAIVLGAIPGMTQELGQRIVQARQEGLAGGSGRGVEEISSIAWLVEKGIVDWGKLSELEPYITTRSDVFSLQSVGFRDDRSPVFRSTVLIDARQIPAQIRDLRVWHPWDRGFTTETLTQSVP
jgi:hypothetical protein